jgi:ATP-dependent protease HslVU (ClpYQ) ATPase subunit
VRILKEPDFNLLFQQVKLMEAEQLKLSFTEEVAPLLARP